jgi:UDP-glucose 4-epimerase
METILVTGGAGYIGSVTCEILLKEGYNLVIIDDLSEGNAKSISSQVSFFKGNFGDEELLKKIFTTFNIDFVFHFAASANVPDSVINPSDYYFNNFINTFSLLKKMKQYNVDKIIVSSTAAVFGEPVLLPIDENHQLRPINPYGHSKLMMEQMIKDYSFAYGLKYIVFRYFCAAGATNNNGESRRHETHLIPVILDHVMGKRDKVFIFGQDFETIDGTGVRDYIHVVDIAEAHILGMKNFDKATNSVFNLGTNSGYSVLQVIERVSIILKKKIDMSYVPIRPGDPAILVASNKKANEILGWEPKFGINDIIASSFTWRVSPKY